MKTILVCVTFLLAACTATSQWQSIGAIDQIGSKDATGITLRSGPAVVQVTALSDDVVRVRLSPSGTFDSDRSVAIVGTPGPSPTVAITENDAAILLKTARLTVRVQKSPLRIAFLDKDGAILCSDDSLKGMAWCGKEVRVWKSMPIDEHYYGFGEKAGALDRTAMAMTMWNTDIPAYGADTDPLYETVPFFYAIRKGNTFGIFFDNSYRSSFDMGKESRSAYSFGAEDGDLNYYFFAGSAPATILEEFTSMVGRMPLPPIWSLGYQQCRWSYPTEKRVREIADGFRARAIPCDVIYLDIDYMDGYRIFTFNPKNFPEPKRLTTDLAAQGFKMAVIVDPGIKTDTTYHAFRTGLTKNCFLTYPDGSLYTGKVWPGVCAFPDFTAERVRAWWGENFKVLTDAGIRGWWNDMNEPSVFDVPSKTMDLQVVHDGDGLPSTHAKNHNVYGMQMTRGTYEGVRKLLPNERPFVLTRASYAGGWRYSAAWTGDNVSSWDNLAMAASMCLNLSMSGQPFVGADIGGFIGYPSGELFARWLELGVFTPLMRAHSAIGEKNKEPWEYGDTWTDVNRRTIGLRYQMLPYIYNVMAEASATGLPAMRAMIFAYPSNPSFSNCQDQFLFGDNLLVAPVLVPDVSQRSVRLPEGTWYDYWSDSVVTGPASVTVSAPVDRLPIFVKAGTVLPTQQIIQSTAFAAGNPLTFTAFPGAEGIECHSTYYEDDGHSFEYEKGVYAKRTVSQVTGQGTTTLRFSRCEGSYIPPERRVVIALRHLTGKPGRVTVNGDVVREGSDSTTLPSWTYDPTAHMARVVVTDSRNELTVAFRK